MHLRPPPARPAGRHPQYPCGGHRNGRPLLIGVGEEGMRTKSKGARKSKKGTCRTWGLNGGPQGKASVLRDLPFAMWCLVERRR